MLGRFISKDPFDGVKQDPQSLNGYIYVGNNPVNLTDPSGKCVPWCVAAIGWVAANPWVAAGAMAAFTTHVMNVTGAGQAIAKWAEATWDDLTTLWSEQNDPPVGNLKRLPDPWIERLGGEDYTADRKKDTGGSRADLYYDPDTRRIYSVPKGGGEPQYVDDLPEGMGE